MSADVSLSRRLIAALAVVGALLWFAALGSRALIHPDEGRYAEIPREMVATGDWLTPRLNGLKYFEKPPLQYWATAVLYKRSAKARPQRVSGPRCRRSPLRCSWAMSAFVSAARRSGSTPRQH
jgi:hypothetical protein